MRTKKVRVGFEIVLHYPDELDSVPAVGTPEDYLEAFSKTLQKSLRRHKDKRVIETSPLRMNIRLDFRK